MSDSHTALPRLLDGFSVEVSNRRAEDVRNCQMLTPAGTRVFVAFGPKDTWAASLATATRLRQGGLDPVPHIAARYFSSLGQLDSFIARLRQEAAVDRVFLIGGDVARPAGPFSTAVEVLETGLLAKHGVRHVGFAGYPEGHPKIAENVLIDALARKLELAARQKLDAFIVTQFCFEPDPIAGWLRRYRANGFSAPVRIGVAGPASVTTLARFGLRCGIGASMRALSIHGGKLMRLARDAAPDALLHALVRSGALEASPVVGVHFFTFGGIPKLKKWLNGLTEDSTIASLAYRNMRG